MSQKNNQLEEQGNKPLNELEGLEETHQSGEDIRSGARNEDQLDKIKQDVPEGGRDAYPERQSGAPANTGDENLETQ